MNKNIQIFDNAISIQNSKLTRKVSHEIIIGLVESGTFPDSLFDKLLSILKNETVQKWEYSYLILKVFEDGLEYLTETQKEHLIDFFVLIYGQFTESTSCLLIVEMIVDLYRNEKSLNALKKIMGTNEDIPRSMIPEGFEYYISESCEEHSLKIASKILEGLN